MINSQFQIDRKHIGLISCHKEHHYTDLFQISHGILALYLDFIQINMVSDKTAIELVPNEVSQIIRFDDMIIAGKLMAMGILPNAKIELVRRNALGYTLIFRINSRFKIALRKDEAKNIIIKGA